jgi:hypothetical protein
VTSRPISGVAQRRRRSPIGISAPRLIIDLRVCRSEIGRREPVGLNVNAWLRGRTSQVRSSRSGIVAGYPVDLNSE